MVSISNLQDNIRGLLQLAMLSWWPKIYELANFRHMRRQLYNNSCAQ
jgi:hypothetical protein